MPKIEMKINRYVKYIGKEEAEQALVTEKNVGSKREEGAE